MRRNYPKNNAFTKNRGTTANEVYIHTLCTSLPQSCAKSCKGVNHDYSMISSIKHSQSWKMFFVISLNVTLSVEQCEKRSMPWMEENLFKFINIKNCKYKSLYYLLSLVLKRNIWCIIRGNPSISQFKIIKVVRWYIGCYCSRIVSIFKIHYSILSRYSKFKIQRTSGFFETAFRNNNIVTFLN